MTPDKNALRQSAKELRQHLHETEKDAAETIASIFPEKLFTRFGPVVAGYIAIGSELDPSPLLARLSDLGAKICLPRVEDDGSMTFRHVEGTDSLTAGPFGLTQPSADAPLAAPTLVLTPMLAFDAQGNRLGYGKGHYDRALEKLRQNGRVFVCGLAYAGQIVPVIPAESTDIPLDWMVTETGSLPLFFGRAAGA